MDLNEFNTRKRKLEQLVREHTKLEGSLEHDFQELEQEHGCSSVAIAKDHLSKLEKQGRILEKKIKKKTQSFEKQWGSILDG